MNRKKIQFIALIIALLSVFPSITRAQQETYNYKQALQSLQNKDTQAAIAYLYKDLANNPKNSKAWMLMSGAYGMLNNADSALFAIDNAIKFAPKTNENMLVACYKAKAEYLQAMGFTELQLKTLNQGVKQLPKSIDMLKLRGEFYSNNNDNEKAIADYKKILSIDRDNVDAMSEIGVQYLDEDKVDESLKWFNKALATDNSHTASKFGRALAYLGKKELDPALDDLTQLLKETESNRIKQMILSLADSTEIQSRVINKISALSQAEPKETIWLLTLGDIHNNKEQYEQARQYFQKAYEIKQTADIATELARQYFAENNYAPAKKWATQAIELARDSSETNDNIASCITFLGQINFDQGNYTEAIKYYTQSIQEIKNNANARFFRAQAYIFAGKQKEALADLNEALETASGGTELAYVWRGWLLNQLGKKLEAQGDFRNAIEQDSVPYPAYPTFISQHFLGIDATAKQTAKSYLEISENKGAHIEVACLYALLGDKPMAVHHLELGIEKGYCSFPYIRNHPWLKSLRGYPDYEKLIKKYSR